MLATSSVLASNATSTTTTAAAAAADDIDDDHVPVVTNSAKDLGEANESSQKCSTIESHQQQQQQPESCDHLSASSNSNNHRNNNNNNNSLDMSSSTSHLRVSSASPPIFDAQLLQSHPSPLNYSSCSPTAAATAASVFDFDPLSSPDDSRQSLSNRNKRKNFQPRCITDEEEEEEGEAKETTATKVADDDDDGQPAATTAATAITTTKSLAAFDISQTEVESSQPSPDTARAKQFAELALLLKNIRQIYPQLANIPESLLLPLVANEAAVGGLLSGLEASQQPQPPAPAEPSTPTGSKDVAGPNGFAQDCSLQEQYLRLLQLDSSATGAAGGDGGNVPAAAARTNSKGHPKEEAEDDPLVGDHGGGGGHQQHSSKTSDGEEHSSSMSNYNEDEEDEGPDETINDTIKGDPDFEDQEHEIGAIGGGQGAKERQKMMELEKLNQLENLYRLNLLQQQHQQLLAIDAGGGGGGHKSLGLVPPPPNEASLLASFAAASVAAAASGDAQPKDIYGKNINNNNNHHSRNNNNNRPAGPSGKAPVSRRPLSSWKQSISACGPGPAPWVDKATLISLSIQAELINNKSNPIDYTHYVKRYANAAECGNNLCRELNYREHFHCNAQSCNARVFMKKEEMIRHFKWHKKRDESLTHGFLRCSPIDQCIERFANCPHHRKQTHYHCLKRGCDKVYISTSDVQMHANYHRKDTAIIQEGFQRFRATENCLLESCAFFGQKTTHFHCKRDNCNHTFKNKADMEKHKSYHIRDEQLARDGFKKFMKHETCSFDDCRSSRVCNHIHCIRPGCTHVLHSTGQLYPHRRKHERRESELAYRKYRLAQAIHRSNNNNNSLLEGLDSLAFSEGFDSLNDEDTTFEALAAHLPLAQMVNVTLEEILGIIPEPRCEPYMERHKLSHDCVAESATAATATTTSLEEEHFACRECVAPRRCSNRYEPCLEHARRHVMQEEATRLMFEETADVNTCTPECALHGSVRHWHCRMYGCPMIVPIGDRSLTRLKHYKFHEEQQAIFQQEQEMTSSSSNGSPANKLCKPISIEQLLQMRGSNPNIPGLLNLALPGRDSEPSANRAAAATTTTTTSPPVMPRTSPKLQVFPTGTTLTSVDGLPVLKRKRGRPPKNRVLEGVSNLSIPSTSGHSTNGRATSTPTMAGNPNYLPLGPLSAFDLATALNLPLRHANLISNIQGRTPDEASKTIPVPMIMPYLRPLATGGFYAFDADLPCPDVGCRYFGRRHFHCSKPRCFYVSEKEAELNGHAHDFHEAIDIMEGFVYFDQAIDCKLPTCGSNRRASHFHCTRAGCNFSFVQYSAMAWHEREAHGERTNQSDEDQEMDEEGEHGGDGGGNSSSSEPEHQPDHRSRHNGAADNDEVAKGLEMFHSLQRMFHEQQRAQSNQHTPPPGFHLGEASFCEHASCNIHRVHHHCEHCSQTFSTIDRLLAHTLKHEEQLKASMSTAASTNNQADMSTDFSSESNRALNFQHEMSAELSQQQQQQQQNFFQLLMSGLMGQQTQQLGAPLLPFNPVVAANFMDMMNKLQMDEIQKQQQQQQQAPLKRRTSFSSDGSDISKRLRVAAETEGKSPVGTPTHVHHVKPTDGGNVGGNNNNNNNSKSVIEEPSPNGYLRFRFNESCGFQSCVYREHQTHFHCMRKNCFYSFCDKTRFVQHTARHERMDTLMGGDFQQFRSTVNCGREGCEYAAASNTAAVAASSGAKTSHYHCLKCSYTCADTNRVVAHRRQHEKMENIIAAGFERFVPGADCRKEACNYRTKQTHYHCTTCNYSVLGLSQMSAHKARHEQQLLAGKAASLTNHFE